MSLLVNMTGIKKDEENLQTLPMDWVKRDRQAGRQPNCTPGLRNLNLINHTWLRHVGPLLHG
jgi:hypothetical protein